MRDLVQRLVIVIPVFNGWDRTRKCLRALREGDFTSYSVVVVDHGSTDATESRLPVEFPEVIRLSASEDLWWAGASNVGIKFALEHGARFVMLLNNDCYLAPGAVGLLMEEVACHQNAIIAPVQRDYATSAIMSLSPFTCTWLGFAGCRGPVKISPGMESKKMLDVKLIGGGRGVIVPARVFEEVGFLDEDTLPHYYADHDFYLRCRARGIPLKVLLKAEVFVDGTAGDRHGKLAELTVAEFVRSLRDRRSHRNLEALSAFFRKHYPIRKLYWVGLALSVLRHSAVYAMRRSYYLVSNR